MRSLARDCLRPTDNRCKVARQPSGVLRELAHARRPVCSNCLGGDKSVMLPELRLLGALLLIAVFFQSLAAQTHIHQVSAARAAAPLSLIPADHFAAPGSDKQSMPAPRPGGDDAGGCVLCQAAAHANGVFPALGDIALSMALPFQIVAMWPEQVGSHLFIRYGQQQRAPLTWADFPGDTTNASALAGNVYVRKTFNQLPCPIPLGLALNERGPDMPLQYRETSHNFPLH